MNLQQLTGSESEGISTVMGRLLVTLYALAIVAILAPADLFAQGARQIEIRDLEQKDVATPSFSVTTDSERGPRKAISKWLEIRSEYKTAPDWVDEAQFKYFVAFEAKDPRHLPKAAGGSRINVLTGDVTYEDIPKGGHLSTMYLSPSKYFRYGKVIGYRVEVYVSGQLVHGESVPQRRSLPSIGAVSTTSETTARGSKPRRQLISQR